MSTARRTASGPSGSVEPGAPGSTRRTQVRRVPHKAVLDRDVLLAILDAGRVGHLAIVDNGQPYAIPVAYARDQDRVLLHGSTGSRLFRALAGGAPACLTVTLIDGLVLARSAFASTMNYRCAMVLGQATVLEDTAKLDAIRQIVDHLLPERWADVRPSNNKELAATMVLALPLTECSVKLSDTMPNDDEADLDLPAWAGVVPVREVLGDPIPAPTLRPGITPPSYLERWQ